ncbi:MAG: DUF1385 domain-containing protein [Pseudomonadota bacterium]
MGCKNKKKKDERPNLGGQAVIEGVMMRSPNSMAISVRTPEGQIILKETRWRSLWEKYKFLRKPFLRGVVVVLESLINGIQALAFSANQALPQEEKDKMKKDKKKTTISDLAIAGSIVFAFFFGAALFVYLPHILTEGLEYLFDIGMTVDTVIFHLVDGIIKILIFLAYVYLISLYKEIKRVFEYHGAEHKAIFAYENDDDLTIESVKKYTTFHPRCGTSFLIMVILISICVFSIIYPLLPQISGLNPFLEKLLIISIKIPLIFPIGGIAYEIIRYAGYNPNNKILNTLVIPGMWLQRITTQEPSDDQLEVAIASIKSALYVENSLGNYVPEKYRFKELDPNVQKID